jgi:hypothetical protein
MEAADDSGNQAAAVRSPEAYVVRIYRRDARSPGKLAGTVEIVADGSEVSFSSLRELDRILSAQPPGIRATARG